MCLEFTAGFMLLSSLLWLLDANGILSALLPAMLIHELGHALAIRCCGGCLTKLRFEACGLLMEYSGVLSVRKELFCAFSGPAAGILYALAAAAFGRHFESEFLLCSAGISILLSIFNLLPAPMLDGGRILALLRFGKLRFSGIAAGTFLSLIGFIFLRRSYGPITLLAGFWLLIGTCKYAKLSI